MPAGDSAGVGVRCLYILYARDLQAKGRFLRGDFLSGRQLPAASGGGEYPLFGNEASAFCIKGAKKGFASFAGTWYKKQSIFYKTSSVWFDS